jgi:dTDP-4-amino-4,6-dideoxygalactose transaminase
MDPNLLEEAIKDRIKKGKKPKAVIVVHLYGQPAKLSEIISICTQYEIPLIEDAAEALGSEYHGRRTGTFGQFSILSFNGNKIITTSGGGMLISDKPNIDKVKFLSTQARNDAPHYEHTEIGYNYRMSNILAGIGRGQLQVIKKRVQQKRNIFEFYKENLGTLPGIEFQPELLDTKSNRWLTAITINHLISGTDREKIRCVLTKNNIDSRPLWKPMHLQPVFNSALKYENGISEKLFQKGLCLPSGTALTKQELNMICSEIKALF